MMAWNLVHILAVSNIPFYPLLLAGRPQFKTSSDGSAIFWVIAIGAVIAVVVAGLSVATRVLHQRSRNSQSGLFDGLCKHHELPRNSRALLKQLAASYGLAAAPARVFTEPRWLEPNPGNPLFRTRAAELAALRERLFGNGQGAEAVNAG